MNSPRYPRYHSPRGPPLHPFQGTGTAFPGDTSVDTSLNRIQDESDLSEPHQVRAVWGEIGLDAQGPAGSVVPEVDNEAAQKVTFEEMPDAEDTAFRYDDDPDAPEDAEGPHPILGHSGSFTVNELNDPGANAAASAAMHARRSSTSSMLEKMDAAEESYEQQVGTVNSPTSSSPTKERSHGRPSSELRAKVVARIQAALEGNAQFVDEEGGHDLAAAADHCENGIYNITKSLPVYQSAASNAVRVATQVTSVAELLRVALGSPREDVTHADISLHDLSGLQPIAMKIDSA